MKYTVVWMPAADNVLTTLWLGARDRIALREAADEIDVMLARSAREVGESRWDNVRITFCGPLGALFEVFDEDRKVCVLRVWRCR